MHTTGAALLFLLSLRLPLLTASPLSPAPHSFASSNTSQTFLPLLEILTIKREEKILKRDIQQVGLQDPVQQTNSAESRTRLRRAFRSGCHLGTCQVHILANTLYRMGKSSGKDESRKANDPQGYGR